MTADRLAWEETGEGPPVVLIHGIGSRRQVWAPLVAALGGGHRVISVDLPGHGSSGPLPGDRPWGVEAYTDAVERFVDDIGIDRPHVVGNSLGGAVALELTRRGRTASAVAMAPIGFWRSPEDAWCVATLRASSRLAARLGEAGFALVRRPAGRAVLLAQMFGQPVALDAASAAAELQAFIAATPALRASLPWTSRYRFSGALPDVPVTVLWGTRDRLLWPWQALRAQRALPRARHARLRRAGHVLMVDEPGESARLVAATIAAARRNAPG